MQKLRKKEKKESLFGIPPPIQKQAEPWNNNLQLILYIRPKSNQRRGKTARLWIGASSRENIIIDVNSSRNMNRNTKFKNKWHDEGETRNRKIYINKNQRRRKKINLVTVSFVQVRRPKTVNEKIYSSGDCINLSVIYSENYQFFYNFYGENAIVLG